MRKSVEEKWGFPPAGQGAQGNASSADDLGPLLHVAESAGWETAFFDYTKARITSGHSGVEDQRMADWQYLLPLGKDTVALALGCGWGTVPIALAETCKTVYAVDTSWAQIAFLAARTRQQHVHNLFPIHVGGGLDLPFHREQFDLVSLAGFRWMPHQSIGVTDVVRRVRDLLRSGGVAYLCLGNRLSFSQLLRRRRSGSPLPLHSMRGYRRILEAEGLTDIRFYAPLPSWDGPPLFYLPLEDPRAVEFFFRQIFPLFEMVSPEVKRTYAAEYAAAKLGVRLTLLAQLTGLAKLFVPGFGIVARKPGKPRHAA
jgi:SAM-dependent methyltransferase